MPWPRGRKRPEQAARMKAMLADPQFRAKVHPIAMAGLSLEEQRRYRKLRRKMSRAEALRQARAAEPEREAA